MWYIIIGLIIIGIISSIFEWLSDLVGGAGILVGIIVVFVVAFLAFSWRGVLAVIGIAIGVALLSVLLSGIKDTISKHDKDKIETAQIKKETQVSKEMHENETALRNELETNCRWLGFMNEKMWAYKLPNYVNKGYATSFNEITKKFATQMEHQNIRQNDDWFQPFLQYVLTHPQGSTVTKMMNEVSCPQFHATHTTLNGDLLNTRMVKGTERVSKDVPPLFEQTFIKEMNENLFTPTKYALKLYGVEGQSNEGVNHIEEISFDDL